ncbi:DNA polymerase III subunit alpha [Christiangramia salexigens]|uniref:DNA polymerase III subunit alpha n=1 Tax=Christiangramia salexigens TaxID=1913577 RepID=A0A1L3J792_9FLAO|nr:DNA polymerase III subunit alpha [Christiangramia salexigens]APG61006.1 DNA polymerase III subunit alpha [Christiangramia salexigens]
MYLIFDTETTGLPKRWDAPLTDSENWPRCIQIAWQLHDDMGNLIENQDYLVKPDGFDIPYDSERIHGISTDLANEKGIPLQEVLEKFNDALNRSKFVVGQNVGFDINIMGAEFIRMNFENSMQDMPVLDTCTEVTASLCKIPGGRGGKFKLPTLTELHEFLFDEAFAEAHNATADVEATTRCFLELIRQRVYTVEELDVPNDYFENFSEANPQRIELIGLKHINLKKASDQIRKRLEKQQPTDDISHEEIQQNLEKLDEVPFAHLHNHSQFSVLQSTISIPDLVAAAAEENMNAVALTDHANMMGAFHFVKEVGVYNGKIKEHNATAEENGEELKQPMKAIVGCEFFVCENHADKSRKDNGYQIVMLAKNKNGYHNLAKMSSKAYTDGFYYVPRIDKEIVKKYKEDVIVLTGNLYGEVPSKILNVGEKQAEEALLWWKEEFGEDFYIELMRHNQEDENRVNPVLVEFSKKHDIKLVATNNTYYWKQEDANAHDILLCVKDGEKQATPIGRGRGYRYGLPNDEYYFKSGDEMKSLFKDLPEAISNIQEVVDKVEPFELARDVLLPKFTIPEEFQSEEDLVDGGKRGENAFLKHITFEGAKKRYSEVTPDIAERLNFELSVIENTGYPGYFLIVEDFIRAAREMGVSVGPGRGSAAGSAVAYCLGITNIDPIKYDLLFERFLNPDRVSMPDIDIDFDDEGRSRVMDYVIKKYGANQVAQIITYGTMAAKSSIRDTARVLDLPLMEADRIAKLIPNTKLGKLFAMDDKTIKAKFRGDEIEKINELLNISEGDDLEAETVNQARILEGSVRNTGIHACGVIITPGDITNYVPVSVAKDSDLYVTQFDNSVVESAGLLKMDFLGLKTLTLIKDTVKIVKGRHNIDLDPDSFPLDDEETYKLFQRGETIGIFQYESPGMQKHMQALKPTVFDDLIAMNALYRPGPMEYIPSFIARKHGDEEISYDLPEMEEYLEETYGITVYQEQVMLLSQKLAGFSKGEADMLRKAMGKKIAALLAQLKPKFIGGGEEKGHPTEVLEKIWKDWEAFASYAFNKSHSTCYAWIAYQTAYLKAHYPAEYMAAVLSNNMNDIKQVTFFMEECKRMKLNVLGPDVNESYYKFSVNKENAIRFGMGAIKGVGAGAVATIVENRKNNEGPYRSIFDMAKRIDLRAANKKAFENLALAGGFDGFGSTHRAQYFHDDGNGMSFLEKVIKYAAKYQESQNSSQVSLFGEASDVQIPEPEVPPCEEWGTMEKLRREKEVVGIYISGHPLDDFRIEMNYFCNGKLSDFRDLEAVVNRDLTIGGVVTDVQHRVSKNGKGWAIFTVEDYDESYEFKIFGEEYLRMKHFFVPNNFVHIKCFVKEGWTNKETGKKGEPRIQFREMNLLHDVMDKNARKLTIQLNIDDLKNEKIEWLKETFTSHKGDCHLNFVVYEMKEQVKLRMPSRKHKIRISQELIEALEKEQFMYKLN